MYQETKKEVLEILINEPLARSNDRYLIYRVLKAKGLPTDLSDLTQIKGLSFESITRARRKWQQAYPELRSNKPVSELRQALFDQIKADAIGVRYE